MNSTFAPEMVKICQFHPDFISMTPRVKILDFRLRILDLWNRCALSI